MQHNSDIQGPMDALFFTQDEDGYNPVSRPKLHCPYCGHDYVHMKKPMYFTGGDLPGGDYEASHVFNMGVRGDVMVLSFWSECEHEWSLVFGFHKGHVFYDLIVRPESEVR